MKSARPPYSYWRVHLLSRRGAGFAMWAKQCSLHDQIELALTLIKKRPARRGIFLFVRERTLT
jgi:hypothetical protein